MGMINFGCEKFAVMSRGGEWRELNATCSIEVAEGYCDPWYSGTNETTITLKMPNSVFEKALYARGFIGKVKCEPFYADNKLTVVPYYLRDTILLSTVKNIIINPPATIVFWNDGTKTVCKCAEGDTFDPEKGIAMCFFRKMLGSPSQVRKFMKQWVKDYE